MQGVAWYKTGTATNGTAATTEIDETTYGTHYVTHISASVGVAGTPAAAGYLTRLVSRAVTVTADAVTDAGNSTTVFKTGLTAANDTYNGLFLRFLDGTNAGELRTISDYAQTDGLITVSSAFTNVPLTTHTFEILTDTALMNWVVSTTGPLNVNFSPAMRVPMNTAVYADIAAATANVVSHINLAGYSK